MSDIDTTGDDALGSLHGELRELGIVLLLARVNGAVRDFMRRDGVMARIGEDNVFATLHDADEAARSALRGRAPHRR